jgi:hypothetical protein
VKVWAVFIVKQFHLVDHDAHDQPAHHQFAAPRREGTENAGRGIPSCRRFRICARGHQSYATDAKRGLC